MRRIVHLALLTPVVSLTVLVAACWYASRSAPSPLTDPLVRLTGYLDAQLQGGRVVRGE